MPVFAQWTYCIVSPTLKLSVLWFYRTIFDPQTRMRIVIHAGIIFNIISYTGLFFISLLACMPLERRWNPFVQGYCLPGGVTAYLSGAINVFTDAFVVFLPIPVIWRLNVTLSRKARALGIFSLGIMYGDFDLLKASTRSRSANIKSAFLLSVSFVSRKHRPSSIKPTRPGSCPNLQSTRTNPSLACNSISLKFYQHPRALLWPHLLLPPSISCFF
jgi:hypothetical protein